MNPSRRIRNVQTPIIPVVGDLIRKSPGTISLGQGMVYYPPPERAMARVRQAVGTAPCHTYSPVEGLPALLEQIRKKLAQDNGISAEDSRHVVVTAGANMGFVHAITAITDPGDEVILLTPYYFNHEMALRMLNCTPVLVPTDARHGLQVEAVRRAITPRTRAVVTISPNNPTGVVYDHASLRAINQLCRQHRIFHISDEAYEYFTFDSARHFSPASMDGAMHHTISLFSLSKAYGMAGWRVGYMVLPPALVPAIKKIQDTVLICPPVASQQAALGALELGAPYCHQFLAPLAEVRHLVYEGLSSLGPHVSIAPARGAFYFFIRVDTTLDAMATVRWLIERYQVGVIPGVAFGMDDGCYLRIAYGALARDTVAEAMDRLVRGLSALLQR